MHLLRWPNLAKRKGQNAIRPDIIRVPLSEPGDIAPLADELSAAVKKKTQRRGNRRSLCWWRRGIRYSRGDGGRTASGRRWCSGHHLHIYHDPDWAAYEECVRAALAAHVPLWLRAENDRPARDQFEEVTQGTAIFPEVDLVLEMAHRAHALGHRGLVLSVDAFNSTPSYTVRANRLLSTRLTELAASTLSTLSPTRAISADPSRKTIADDRG